MNDSALFDALKQYGDLSYRSWVIALSGGVDSCVLLHAASQYLATIDAAVSLRAIHINHRLQPQAQQWAAFCQAYAEALQLDCQVYHPASQPDPHQSIEAWAREQRYDLLSKHVANDELVLTAHSQDDQAETILLQLMRAAGEKGLSAMPVHGHLHGLNLCRPLLHISRSQIEAYAKANQIDWVEDPTNRLTDFKRNFLRLEVIPLLEQNQPGVKKALAASAAIASENQSLLDDLASMDLNEALDDKGGLRATRLAHLSSARLKNVLRFWLSQKNIPLPPRGRLNTMVQQMQAKEDANPHITWAQVELRRYRGVWYAQQQLATDAYVISWHGQERVELPNGLVISFVVSEPVVLQELLSVGEFQIKPVSGYTQPIRSNKHQCSKSLKKWWQQFGVAPWQRLWWPGLFYNNRLINIVGMFAVEDDEMGRVKIECKLEALEEITES